MQHVLTWRFWVFILCLIGTAFPISAKDFEKETSRLFEKRFSERKIDGTGHLFWIVAECDKKRLKAMSDSLSNEEMKVLEYEFTFEVNTKQKAKARIIGGGLEKSVEQCIIDQYYKDVTFLSGPWVPEVMADKIRFPAVLVKGKQPTVPKTPIGFVTQEQ